MDSDEQVHMSPDHSDLQDSCTLLCCDGAQEESRVNSRLGPVSELPARGRFSGRAEPRLEPRLLGATGQPCEHALLHAGGRRAYVYARLARFGLEDAMDWLHVPGSERADS